MAITTKGTPYVQSSDLVSAFPSSSLALANHIDANVAYNALTINAQTGTSYTFALADATLAKLVTASNAAAQTYTVAKETTTAWPTGSILQLLNIGAGAVTIVGAVGVTVNNATAVISQWESVAIVKVGTDTWTVTRGGSPKALFSTTGSPSITTRSDGKTVYKWSGDGSLVVSNGIATVDLLLVGGGGSGVRATPGAGGGGGGGVLAISSLGLPPGTYSITLGVGGAAPANGVPGNNGGNTVFGPLTAYGGGGGAYVNLSISSSGGCGGGGSGNTSALTTGGGGLTGQGFAGGGRNASQGGGGGGGASAAGTTATTAGGGNGGAGISNNFETLLSQTYGGGGGGSTSGAAGAGGGTAGSSGTSAAGTDGLGGGSGGAPTTVGKGGNGVVIVVIK